MHIGASAPRFCSQRSAPPHTRASTCWSRSGRLRGGQAGSCRSRWLCGPCIHSRCAASTRRGRSIQTTERRPAYISWLAAGAAFFAAQGLMFITSISIYRQATSANVLYSSRGLWSVVAYGPSATGSPIASSISARGARVAIRRCDPADGGHRDGAARLRRVIHVSKSTGDQKESGELL